MNAFYSMLLELLLVSIYSDSAEMRFHYKRIAVVTFVLIAVSLSVFILTQYGGSSSWFGSKKVRKKKIVTIQDKIEEELSK